MRNLCDGDTFEVKGRTFRFRTEQDDHHGAPWDEEDGHGPVSASRFHPFGHGTKPPKKAGERILFWDRGSYRTYDMQEACRLARTEWGFTSRKAAAEAAQADYERMRGWCTDQWSYVGVVITLMDDDEDPTGIDASLWGIKSDAYDHHVELAHELADEILHSLKGQNPCGL